MRRIQRISMAAAFVLASLAAVSISAQEKKAESECNKARAEWLAANPLPTTYEQLLAVDQAHRNLALSALTPELRSAMWRRHLGSYLEGNRYRLNDLQVALIERGIDLASPLFFSFRVDTPGRASVDAAIEAIAAEAATLFSKDEVAAIFKRIGSQEERLAPGTGQTQRLPDCNCRNDEDCFVPNCERNRPPFICYTIVECGFYADQVCTGLCV
jgi:hypothetical protein